MVEFEHSPLRPKQLPQPPSMPSELEQPLAEFTGRETFTSEQVIELLDVTYADLGLEDDLTELQEVLGHRQVLSPGYPLVSNKGFNYHGDEEYQIPGVVRLGSRSMDVAVDQPITGTNLLGAKGKIVFYRTRQVPDDTDNPNPHSSGELYHEAGFFCLVQAIHDPKTDEVKPYLAYGDIDRARWLSQDLKLRLVTILDSAARQEYLRNLGEDARKFDRLDRDLFGIVSKGVVRRRLQQGVLRQNQEPILDMVLEQFSLKDDLRKAMQAFIETHAQPSQMSDGGQGTYNDPDATELAQPNIQPVGIHKRGRTLYANWASEHEDQEHLTLPFVQAVAEASGMSAKYSLLFIQRSLGMLLKDIPQNRLLDTFQRDHLSDEEVRQVHNSFEKISSIHINDDLHYGVSMFWKKFLQEYPQLYPGVTEESLLAEAGIGPTGTPQDKDKK